MFSWNSNILNYYSHFNCTCNTQVQNNKVDTCKPAKLIENKDLHMGDYYVSKIECCDIAGWFPCELNLTQAPFYYRSTLLFYYFKFLGASVTLSSLFLWEWDKVRLLVDNYKYVSLVQIYRPCVIMIL